MAMGKLSRFPAARMVSRAMLCILWLDLMNIVSAYRIGDIVPMSRKGQYHAMRTDWQDVIGHHCPIFGVYREVLLPIPKPVGYTGADAYKM